MELYSENLEALREEVSRKRKKVIIVIFIILILTLCVFGGIIWYRSSRSAQNSSTRYWFDKMAQNGALKSDDPADIQTALDTIVEEGMFNASIKGDVYFESATAEGLIGISNIEENHYYCRVILTKDDDGEVLYESSGIKPGQYIDRITLSKQLEAGEYPCTAIFIITDPASFEDIGQIKIQVNVHVSS